MAKVRIGINGFGRIGRGFVRCLAEAPDAFDLVLINDLTDVKTLGHLLKHDSVHGASPAPSRSRTAGSSSTATAVKISAEKDPAAIEWKDAGVDIVIESTGKFVDKDGAGKHLAGGAKKVLISAPAKEPDVTLCMGINLDMYKPAEHHIISNASCTTNCLAPVAKVLHETFGIVQRHHDHDPLVHERPADPRPAAQGPAPRARRRAVDDPDDHRRGEGAQGGAARDGRQARRHGDPRADAERLARRSHGAAREGRRREDRQRRVPQPPRPARSRASSRSSTSRSCRATSTAIATRATVDAALTTAIGDLVKVMAWYDNEMGYSQRLFDLAKFVAERL